MNKKNKLNKIIEEKKANSLNKKLRYGLRKLSIGVVSCFLGYAIALTPNLSYANTEPNTVVASNQAEKTTKDESKTTQKENKDMLQGKTVPPVGQVDHSDLSTNKVTEKSTIQKASMVNPIEKTEDKVEKMNTQYTVTYGPGLAYVGNSTTVNISFKQNNKKVNVPEDATFELAGDSLKGASVDKNTGKISYTPDSTVLKDGEKEKNVTVNVKVTYKDQSTSTITATITVRKEESAVPKINPVVEGQTKITGTGVKGAKIEVQIEKTLNKPEKAGETTVKPDGTWEVDVNEDSIKKGDKVRVIQTESNKKPTARYTIATLKNEQDNQQPDVGKQKPQDDGQAKPQAKSEKPTINPVTEGERIISGTGKPGAKIDVTKFNSGQGQIMGSNIVVNDKGKWTLNIPEGIELKKGDTILVNQQEGKERPIQVSAEVQAKKAENPDQNNPKNPQQNPQEKLEKLTINPVTEGDETISGTGKPGAKVNIAKMGNNVTENVLLAKDVDVKEDGSWSAKIDPQKFKAGDSIYAVQKKDDKVLETTNIKVKGISKKPTINSVKEGAKVISGKGEPGAKIDLGRKDKDTAKVNILKTGIVVDKNGDWKAEIDAKKFKVGDTIYAFQKEEDKKISELTEVTVEKADKQPEEDNKKPQPNTPSQEDKDKEAREKEKREKEEAAKLTIEDAYAGDKTLKGKAAPGYQVYLIIKPKNQQDPTINKNATVDKHGNWSANLVDELKEGDKVLVQQGNPYKNGETSTIVKSKQEKPQNPANDNKGKPNPPAKEDESKKELSKFPVANEIKAGDAKITGQGVPDATIVVTKQGENGKEVKATVGEDGKWSVDLNEAAKEGDEFIIKQQEKGKRDSIGILKSVPKNPQVKKPETNTPDGNKPGNNKKPENNPQENKLSGFPVVNEIKAGDTKITGKGVVGATIYVTKVSKNGDRDAASLSTVVGEDGKWSVDLKEAAKEGDEFIIQQQEKGKKDSPRISKVTQKSDKKQNPEKKPEAKKPEGEKKPGETKKPEDNKKPEAKKPDVKKPEKKAPEQKPEVKNPGKTTNPSNNKKQPEKTPEKTPDVKKPETKTPEMKRPEKNAKKPSTQNKKSMDGLSLHYEIKTVKKGAKIKVTPVFKDKSGKIIKMPQGVMFSLDKNSPKGVKIDPKTGELSVDTTGYKNGDKIVVTVVATIKGSTTKVYSLFAKDGKTNQPNEPTKTTEQDTVIKTKVEINIEKSEKNKTNKNNKKASNKKKLPKAGYENEIISLAIAGITTLGGAYITNKKKK